MGYKLGFYFSALLFLAQSVRGEVDVTTQLFGRTIYAHYSYTGFRNTWIGPYGESDIYFAEYDGYLREVSEYDIFNPDSKVRLYVKDCGSGYACLMTRWREDFGYKYYLQADWLDVDFEPASDPSSATEFHWKIFCNEAQDYQVCTFDNRYYNTYGLARIYGTNMYTLKTDWPQDNPHSWYEFRLEVPIAGSEGLVRGPQTACNTGSMPAAGTLDISIGIFNAGSRWSITKTVVDEVRSGFEASLADGSLEDATSWSFELAGGVAFQEPGMSRMNVTARPGTLMYAVQLTGSYGPYIVRGVNVILREESCS